MESAATWSPSLLLLTEQLTKINWSQIETTRAKSICVLKQLTIWRARNKQQLTALRIALGYQMFNLLEILA